MSGVFDETELESAIIELFEREGYEHWDGDAIQRPLDEVLLLEDLGEFLKMRYAALRRESTDVFSCQ